MEVSRCHVSARWKVFTWVVNSSTTTVKSVGRKLGNDNWSSKGVFTPELGYFCVLLVLPRRGFNMWCLAQDEVNGPVYLLVSKG